MAQPRFSIVVATFRRTEEVRALFRSIEAQLPASLEVFVVDQNDDTRLNEIVAEFSPRFPVTHLRSSIRNSSNARNLGLANCSGDIVAFPDDDCVYPPSVLKHVDRSFSSDPKLVALSGPAIAPNGNLGSGRWESTSGEITIDTVWTSVIGFNLFLRREPLVAVNGFDENLGVGARFGSSEEPDLVIRLMRQGGRAMYDTELRVVHPDKRITQVAIDRAFAYGTGMGHVLRKHRVPTRLVFRFLVRPLGGAVLNLAKAKLPASRYYWQTLLGRFSGFVARPGR